MELMMTVIFLIVLIILVFVFRKHNREDKHKTNRWEPTFKHPNNADIRIKIASARSQPKRRKHRRRMGAKRK